MKIKLGFEVQTGKQIDIDLSHLIATGITQLAGKTVTLESLLKRSGLKGIVFKTKIGERGFSDGRIVAPFFKERSDYEFVKSLIEAYSREKLFIEKGTLMELCKGSKNLNQIKERTDEFLLNPKIKGIKREIYIRLQFYLEALIPQIQNANFTSRLVIEDGINIMDLVKFSEEAQSLIIESVVSEVLKSKTKTIIVIPEAWKFIPQKYNNPCKRIVESFIRQGATNQNYIWIDSQDMAGVDKIPLKQISTWILGYQSERNEVKHTLDQLPPPDKIKPQVKDIMTLGTGFFYYASRSLTTKVYVQPYWLSDEDSRQIAIGTFSIEDVKSKQPKIKTPEKIEKVEQNFPEGEKSNELLNYVDKVVGKIQRQINEIKEQNIKPVINIDQIVNQVLSKIPQSGNVVYQIKPIEKIKKDFQIDLKNRIVSDVNGLENDEKRMMKYIEAKGSGVKITELCDKCFSISPTSGGNRDKISRLSNSLINIMILRKDKNGIFYSELKKRITDLMDSQDATSQEIEIIYDNILMEVLGVKTEKIDV